MSLRYESMVLSAPVFVGTGILFYTMGQINFLIVSLAIILSIPILWIFAPQHILGAMVAAALVTLGGGAMQHRVHELSHQTINHSQFVRQISGIVVKIKQLPHKTQVTIDDGQQIFRLTSVYKKYTEINIGDTLIIRDVNLSPIPLPVSIDGYDFEQTAYFQKLSALGVFKRDPEIVPTASPLHRALGRVRKSLTGFINTHLNPSDAAILMAITLGDKSLLHENTVIDIRNSGLAHLMAISGFHLAILGSIIFATVQLIQLALPKTTTYQSKIAAIITALFGGLYLILVDFPISAQRAYIMLALFLLAVSLDRLASGLYSLSLAATLILLLSPESILSPSFQMSFMATLAIVAVYRKSNGINLLPQQSPNSLSLAVNSVKITIVLSLVATLATLPFCIYYFKTFATLGIIANVIVAPVITLIIAPVFLLSLATPVQSQLLMKITGYAIHFVSETAHAISSIPYAAISVRQIPFSSMIAFTLAIILFCSGRKSYMILSFPALMLGLVYAVSQPPPQVFFTIKKDKLLVAYNQREALFINRKDQFLVSEWVKQSAHIQVKKYKESEWEPKLLLTQNSLKITYYGDTVCEISRADLKNNGTHQLWIKDRKVIVKNVRQVRRPWHESAMYVCSIDKK